ncbi:hypothetical protein M2451_003344 [Dysgonomonas sp. PFB1-18]|uniref:hypothetical protein n=1 Tax=unclassified Dysgonomonas TaxID=2630389 RepID=UPI00247722EB|nr:MULTISPECIES: hypothetical protein [unclassified Dysgonomonas]MDH6310566.1 hypothetical protein [Dysgonomonas sp. PF1-14]MDH6340416.1 hypothetical protein [Dysgonomonas sp. PF1-16]MDH6382004.1 hypothetical protein [Dysgonomonas sp. PFB1-18]MDH6399387.1 hypothetical protein [Dysgonomonas sp. PF1-23]
MTTQTSNPHKWLFAHLQTAHGYDDINEARAALVFEYSDGKTSSLSELYNKYPKLYQRMRRDLSAQQKKDTDQLDPARKRLIAAIFGNLEHRRITADMAYVKGIACRAAKEERFNDIPLNVLKNLYNRFKNKNLQNELDELLTSLSL